MAEVKEFEEKKAKADEGVMVTLSKTYHFEGKEIKEIDMSGLEEATAETMIKAQKVLVTNGDVQLLPENSLHYALIIAAECTGLPIEFYKRLSMKDATKVRNRVQSFFWDGDLG
jgi:hypothetical protein